MNAINVVSFLCRIRKKKEPKMGLEWCEDVLRYNHGWPRHEEFQKRCDESLALLSNLNSIQPFDSGCCPTVVCVARNESVRLPAFFDHYRSMGIKRFHIIDNASDDDSVDISLRVPGTTVWRTSASFRDAGFGHMWIAAIVRRYGLGRWVLSVDADEFLVYPGMHRKTISQLVAQISSHGATRMAAPLIDMYSDRSGASQSVAAAQTLKDLLARCSYFDRAVGAAKGYQQNGGWLFGGVRSRLYSEFGGKEPKFAINKVPLALWNEHTAYANIHAPYPFFENPSNAYAALLHFKFLDNIAEKVAKSIEENQHWDNASEYKFYQTLIEQDKLSSFYDSDISVVYRNAETLVEQGLVTELPSLLDRPRIEFLCTLAAWAEHLGRRFPLFSGPAERLRKLSDEAWNRL